MLSAVHKIKENLESPIFQHYHCTAHVLNLLKPFALATKVISASSYPMIGKVKWFFLGIKNHLERSHNNHILQDQVNKMREVFNYYFDQINYLLHIPAFFDSRYKKSAYGE